MDIQFYGANCLVMTNKQARLVVDDNLADLGAKTVSKNGDVAIFTGTHGAAKVEPKIVIDQPGEYEVSGVVIHAIAARAHMDGEDVKNATIYKIVCDESRVLIAGHIYPELSDDQLEAIGTVDVMFVPVGGHGYTIDGAGALKLIKKIEPKIVIPTSYTTDKLNFPIPLETLEKALQALAMEPKEIVSRFKLKAIDTTNTTTQLVVLEAL
ncbi:MAG TPA: MBL fold metallo-hydrolase [Candidatus Saccharimonadales bacterium]|nr:MBL fold metallo-hydrolase [Candidatus Saccharimonadales bacterium]